MSSTMTEEERARYMANRARALAIREERERAARTAHCQNAAAAPAPTAQPSAPPIVPPSIPRITAPPPVAAGPTTSTTVTSATVSSVHPQPNVQSMVSSGPSPSKATSMGGLTAEQLALREANRQRALQRKARAEAAGQHVVSAAAASASTALPVAPARSTSESTARPAPPPVASPLRTAPLEAPLFRSDILVTFTAFNADRFKATVLPFHRCIIEAFKRVPSRIYDEKLRVWTFLYSDTSRVKMALADMKEANVKIDPIPDRALAILMRQDSGGKEKTADNPTGDISSGVDPSLLNSLFPYQKKGLTFGLAKAGRLLIADEMGLGKSVQALAIARYYRKEWPLVIVCPSSVKAAWRGQINRFLPCIRNLYVLEGTRDEIPAERTSNVVIIMSYELMMRRSDELYNQRFSVYIFDESHYLKDGKSKRTKAAQLLAKRAQRIILLSGTPALSRPAELYTQICLIDKSLFPNAKEFFLRYCDGKEGNFGFEAKGCTNSEELSAILQKRLMIRRLKSEVLQDLPEKRREIVYLSSADIDTKITKARSVLKNFDAATCSHFNPNDEGILEYFTMTGTAKATPVCEHIFDNYFYENAPERKVLIFAHHHVVLDTIAMHLNTKGISHIMIDGRTPAEKRGGLCEQFQTDPTIRAAVLSITAAGQGITLTAASVVVFAEIYWIPGSLLQAEDRAHRVGQKDSVFVQYMLAKGTADDLIWPMVQSKLKILGQVSLSSSECLSKGASTVVVGDGEDGENAGPSRRKRRRN